MGRELLVTKEMVFEVAGLLRDSGENPTVREVRAKIGAGGMATILRFLQEWKEVESKKTVNYDYDRIRSFSPLSSFFSKEQKSELTSYGSLVDMLGTHEEYRENIHRKLLVEASWASSALEGNTYSLIDTYELFDRGIEMSGAKMEETRMLLNHKHAIEYVLENLSNIELSKFDIINIHALLSDGLMKDPANVGRLRTGSVRIGGSRYIPPDVPSVVSEEFDALLSVVREIDNPFDQSFYLLANIAYLQPFSDVNKRTSRMSSNIPLLKNNLLPMSFYQMSKSGYEKGVLRYYETGDPSSLISEYISCYKVSAERFKDMVENKPSDNELKLRLALRKEIRSAVYEMVKNGKLIDEVIPPDLDREHDEFFRDHVGKVVDGLHEGNLLLYGLAEADLSRFKASRTVR